MFDPAVRGLPETALDLHFQSRAVSRAARENRLSRPKKIVSAAFQYLL
jgi:hypothetical protein